VAIGTERYRRASNARSGYIRGGGGYRYLFTHAGAPLVAGTLSETRHRAVGIIVLLASGISMGRFSPARCGGGGQARVKSWAAEMADSIASVRDR